MTTIILSISSLITAITVIGGAIMWITNLFIFKPITKQINELSNKIDTNRLDELRYTILSFAGDLRNGIPKTRQEYETIFTFHDKYDILITNLNEKNGYLEREMEYIKKQYDNLLGR